MDRFKITVSSRAVREINSILDYYVSVDSENTANFINGKFERAIDSLMILPRRHPVREPRRDESKTTYGLIVYSYIVYYRVNDVTRVVRVVSVMHGARRQPKRFRP